MMTQPKIGRKEIIVRQWFAENHESQVPTTKSVQELFSDFQASDPGVEVSYGLFNGVIKKMRTETPGEINVTIETQAFQPEILNISEMLFPEFRRWKTDSVLDNLFSDHELDGGIYSGTANIVVGESGVGKSTVLLDVLAKIRRNHEDARVLYISSEMTRNDLFFYYQKNPGVANVPTLLLTDYLNQRFDQILESTLRGNFDVILIDSYQDIVVKMADILGWKTNRAQTWLTNLIIESADKLGKTIFAIQHMTKGGVYVGSTYLKHATTAMMEIRKDEWGNRYASFSKNRRGGSTTDLRLYYSLQYGSVVWADEMVTEDEVKLSHAPQQEAAEAED